jgi:glycosyltransferase involved in cell wall biosynthesis
VGSLLDELKQISTSLGLENSVSWLGHVRDVDNFFSTLDFFVLSSNYEGFGLALLEAMEQGVPIVARNVSAIPEVLGTNHPGLVDSVNPQDFASRIVLMAKNRELIEKCIDLQFTRLKDFSIDKAVNAHDYLYRELLLNGE